MKRSDEIKAGSFLVIGLGLFIMTIFILGRERQIFAKQEEFNTTFSDVKGLSDGAPVRLGGISIGRVAEIGFGNDTKDTRIHVKFLINASYLERLREDSVVSIETQGLLGDKFLSISVGSGEKAIAPGANVVSAEPADLAQVLNKAGVVVDNTVAISTNINEFVETVKKETLKDFTRSTKSIANLAHEVETGNGLLHRLIYSKKDGDTVFESVAQTSKDLNGLVEEIKNGKGFLHALIYDPKGAETLNGVSEAAIGISNLADSMIGIVNSVKTGTGLAHQLIYGESPSSLNDAVNQLNETAANLKKASEALSQGTGTLGALLVDSQLYDNLVEVTDGAKRSFLLRQAIRSSLDK